MADYSAPPTADDLQTFLQASGIFAIPPTARQALFDLEEFLDAAVDEFEHHTGLKPLLPETVDEDRRYDPPGPNYRNKFWTVGGDTLLLTLDPPYQEVTEVYVGDDVGAAGDGTLLTENTQYVLEPVNRQEDQPIRRIRFRFHVVGPRHSVKVVGKCGFWAELPPGVWQAIRAGAAAGVIEAMREGIIAQPTDWREGDSAEKYNVETLLSVGKGFRAIFEQAIAGHRRILI